MTDRSPSARESVRRCNGVPIAVHANHINMVKLVSELDFEYKTLSDHLQM
jgi:hypothetical protein